MSKDAEPKGYGQAKRKAEDIAGEPEKISRLLNSAAEKATAHRKKLKQVWNELDILIQMMRAYRAGEYRRLPWKAIIAAIAAILYFVNPLDLIPDFLFGIGFLDDAAVIGFVINGLHEEIQLFKQSRKIQSPDTPSKTTNGSLPANT